VPHAQRHRGKHPDDERLFGAAELGKLRRGAEEASFLLDRGYSPDAVFEIVGGRHQLEARQRLALRRGVCTSAQYKRHVARELDPEDVARRPLVIDGFNLLITLEVALSGGLLVRAIDGTIRDIAGLSGGYHAVEETDAALDRVGAELTRLRPSRTRWLLDAPVSNSGRLRARILERSAGWAAPATVELVPSADPFLKRTGRVVTTDSAILDACESWFNLGARVIASIPGAWILDLAS
jgi:hypothetical protein